LFSVLAPLRSMRQVRLISYQLPWVSVLSPLRCCCHAEYNRQLTCFGPALLQLMPLLLSTAAGVGHLLFSYSGSFCRLCRVHLIHLSTDRPYLLLWPSHFSGRCLLLSVRLVAVAFIYVVVKLPTRANLPHSGTCLLLATVPAVIAK
jgi:hypothetical protein